MCDGVLSGIAIVISILSFTVSAYVAYRDRGTITAMSRYLESYEHMSDGIFIHVVNSGRRPVTIRHVLLRAASGDVFEKRIGENNRPLRLLENEDHEFQLNAENSDITAWSRTRISKAVVEDSRGREYKIEGLVKSINENAERLQSAI